MYTTAPEATGVVMLRPVRDRTGDRSSSGPNADVPPSLKVEVDPEFGALMKGFSRPVQHVAELLCLKFGTGDQLSYESGRCMGDFPRPPAGPRFNLQQGESG